MKRTPNKTLLNKRDKQVDKLWHERAPNYDKLFWTKDEAYLNAIL
jgi:hypothetical protein